MDMKHFENPITGPDYEKLVEAMKDCAACGKLPQTLEINDISDIMLNDIRSLIAQFEKDSGLDMSFSAELCPYCEKLHAFLFVDYPEEDEILQ